ncbi:MAG TPA: glycosyltransferase family 4 protein [Gemmatimonadales bacterium]|nr:glycosyltransferase family 4 protein [Gemmatimonadales bacterium]
MSAGPGVRRVLLVAPEPFYEDRGTPLAIRQVLSALSELGYQVDLLTFPVGEPLELPGLTIDRISNPFHIRQVPVGLSLRKLLLDIGLVRALRRRIREGGWHYIHAVEEAAFPAVLLGRGAGIPVIYDMQSSLPEQLRRKLVFRSRPVQRLLRWPERWLLRRADAVACSMGLEQYVRRVAPGAQVHEWHFASPPDRAPAQAVAALRSELDIAPEAPVILYSGTMEHYQGLPHLIAAIPRVTAAHPQTVFVLVGGDRDDHAAIRRDAGVDSMRSLRLVPRQPRDRIPAFLSLASVLVSTRAYGNNLPLKTFDYLAAGRPIVATDIPPHRAFLSDELALLVPHGTEPLAMGINRVLDDPALARQLGQAAVSYANQHLGRASFVRSVKRLYDGLAARPHD